MTEVGAESLSPERSAGPTEVSGATRLREGVECPSVDGISTFLDNPNSDQLAEDAFFRASEIENSRAEIYKSLLEPGTGKAMSLAVFDEIVRRHDLHFAGDLLELGGGYGFLSAYIKRRFPETRSVYSDVSLEAVKKSVQYETLFNSRIDEKWVLAAEETPFADQTFDQILFFSSYHHTQNPAQAAKECARLLRPGGQISLLFEPSSPAYFRPFYQRHVNRDEVDEKFYSTGDYRRFFEGAGLEFKHDNYPEARFRWSRKTTAYYLLLGILPHAVRSLLPCTQVMFARKPGQSAIR